MADSSNDSLTALVARAAAGDASANDVLFSTLYHDLHRLAEAHVRRHHGTVTLGVTTLLHEAYIAISKRDSLAFPDRRRFFGYASRAMRGLVINYVRDRRARKRGGELTFTTLDDEQAQGGASEGTDLAALGAALDELAVLEPGLAELVDMKFFCGLTFAEVADVRGVSERTVQRDWAKARLLLHRALSDGA